MVLADANLSLDPAWPWSLPALGLPAMVGVALSLAALTVWTYLGVKKATPRRVALVLLLRLSALTLAFILMMRPSYAVTVLEGVEVTKLLVVFDASESMSVADVKGKSSRWEQITSLWKSREVQLRLDRLKSEQRIEIVKYLGAEDLRPDAEDVGPTGKRTDIGAWLHELWQKHAHEKHLRGIVVFSDGADNGTQYSLDEKARQWRDATPIHAFGAGNPHDSRLSKDIALARIVVEPTIPIKSKFKVKVIAQASGFEKTEVEVTVSMKDVKTDESNEVGKIAKFSIKTDKDQAIDLTCVAPELPGEYKLTVKIPPHPDETNKDNNEISIYVRVTKEKINILWVDRLRVFEAKLAIDLALSPEERFKVRYVEPPSDGVGDPVKAYGFDEMHFDVIVIGDLSAKQFSMGDGKIFTLIRDLVTKKKAGLLMLGGSETFVKGGWHDLKPIMDLLPVMLDVDPGKSEFQIGDLHASPTPDGATKKFLQFDSDAKKNSTVWKGLEPLDGRAPLGGVKADARVLLSGQNGEPILVHKQAGAGHVAVFAADSTFRAWLTPETVQNYVYFWKQIMFWLSNQEDSSNQLWIDLDKRRMSTDQADTLGFRFGLRDKAGREMPKAQFKAKVVGPAPSNREFSVQTWSEEREKQQRGFFQRAKAPGEYRLVIEGTALDSDGKPVTANNEARFLVAGDDREMSQTAANHDLLSRLAMSAQGQFMLAEEASLLQFLDSLLSQADREARHKTTHWPDWQRQPASASVRDQLGGLWSSFALVGFLLFVSLLGCEWLCRRMWGLV